MKTLQNIFTIPEKQFTVTIKEINNNKALLPNALYNQMERFVSSIISDRPDIDHQSLQLFKLQILKNAYLNDTLLIKAQIKKLNGSELHLLVMVMKKNKSANKIICKAIFKFHLNSTISIAS